MDSFVIQISDMQLSICVIGEKLTIQIKHLSMEADIHLTNEQALIVGRTLVEMAKENKTVFEE